MKKMTVIVNPEIIPFLILLRKDKESYFQLVQLLWIVDKYGIKNYTVYNEQHYYHSYSRVTINHGIWMELNNDMTFRKRNSFAQECPKELLDIPIFIEMNSLLKTGELK